MRSRATDGWRTPAWLALGLCALAFAGLRLTNARSVQLFGEIVARVPLRERCVALSFDDGPEPGPTSEVLRALAARGVKSSFFVEGARVEQHPQLARAILAAGHELGNHTYSHRRMVFRSPAFVADEIERTDRVLRSVGSVGPILFRPPFGKKLFVLPWYLAQHHRPSIMWDVEPESDERVAASAPAIVRHIVQHARPGSIVLLHVMVPERLPSLQAVGPAIDGLRRAGFELTTVSDLLQRASRR